jgi:hypothetical protein
MRINRRLFFIAMLAVWWMRSGGVSARPAPYPDDCNDVCSESAACTDTCYATELDFINDTRISCYTWGVYGPPCCGDGSCTEGEDPWSCFDDCHCGDGTCNAGENSANCPVDCHVNPVVEYDCTAAAAACGSQCGETVTWEPRGTSYDYVWIFIPYGIPWFGGGSFVQIWFTVHYYDYSYGNGVENFECDELSATSYCACRY